MLHTVFFDLDGTLTDSGPGHPRLRPLRAGQAGRRTWRSGHSGELYPARP